MSSERLVEVYERLKDLRRRGEIAQLDAKLRPDIAPLCDFMNQRVESILAGNLEFCVRILEIFTLANRGFGDEEKARAWLRRSNKSFSGQKPVDLLKDGLGTAVVREALERIDHGIFA